MKFNEEKKKIKWKTKETGKESQREIREKKPEEIKEEDL